MGHLVGHHFHLLKADREKSQAATEQLWLSMFPNEPYKVDYSAIPVDFSYRPVKVDYDIVSASARQMQFFYNVSLPHFGLVPFLQEAKERYLKFINLKKLNRDAFLVPMYDIDLMWHTHQLSPASYCADTKQWLGYTLNHDDTTTDRSPGSHLNQSFEQTRQLWSDTFQENYSIPGVGYRGPQPRGKLMKISQENINNYKDKMMTCVSMDKVEYNHHEDISKLKGYIKIYTQLVLLDILQHIV